MAPEIARGAPAGFARDVFALGACVAEAFLGLPIGMLPSGAGRLRGFLTLEGVPDAAALVGRLTQNDPATRPSAGEAAEAFPACLARTRIPPRANEAHWRVRAIFECAALADRFAVIGPEGVRWRNQHFLSPFECEGINLGAAGIILGLISIDCALGRNDFARPVLEACRWLAGRPPEPNSAGLFTGNSGVALALATAARRYHRPVLLTAARRRLAHAARDHREIDLFSGAAGVLWTACLLREVAGEDWPLECGEAAFGILMGAVQRRGQLPVFTVPGGSSTPYLGCAHGSAGAAMALAHWGRHAGRQDALDLSMDVFHSLYAHGRTLGGEALRFSPDGPKAHAPATWCHGVAGYLWCVLQAFGDHPGLREEIDWAIESCADCPAAGTPTYCHGLAGRLELWRMLAGFSRRRVVARAQAEKCARALRLAHQKLDGCIAWCSDDPNIITPDLWIGFLGPATALALHTAGAADALLSGRWLARAARRTS